MAFEHYTRSGTKMLRCGYTTGTCAALAAAAATRILLTGRAPETVSLMTGKGIPVEVSITEYGTEDLPGSAWAAVPKDAGDDADVTDGMLIRADVREICDGSTGTQKAGAPGQIGQSDDLPDDSGSQIHIDGGRGVGRVTKPGLNQPVGNAAINSGPRRMIREAVGRVCEELHHEGGLEVIISVPEGEEAARKTFNPKLGIVGGISILGTTGIVEPMSEQALVDTIEVEMRQIAASSANLILTPGNYGSDFIQDQGLDQLGVPVLKFSNFLGETLDMIAGNPVDTVLLVAHAGKLSKVAAGIMNTHSRYADGRNEIFCAHAAVAGASTSLCRDLMEAATTDACIELLDEAGLREHVIGSILKAIQQKLEHRTAGSCRIGAMMFSNVYGLLGMTAAGEEILQAWRAAAEGRRPV